MQFFIPCFLVDDKLRVLRDKIKQDHTNLSIRVLCTPTRSGKCHDEFFNLDEKSNEMVLKIPAVKDSQIFKKLWEKYSGRIKDGVVTVEMLYKIWSKISKKLKSKNQDIVSGEMQVKKIRKYVDMFKMDYKALEDEFMLLSKYFNGATHLDQVKKKLGVVIDKVKSYEKLFSTQQAAQAILQLQQALDLQGDFSEIEEIEEVRSYIVNYCELNFKFVNLHLVTSSKYSRL